ncbi:MAG: hypothetical protein H7345_17865 [Rubritepida sp.]|nr:hypothetical protein [Rubritepida sp.]
MLSDFDSEDPASSRRNLILDRVEELNEEIQLARSESLSADELNHLYARLGRIIHKNWDQLSPREINFQSINTNNESLDSAFIRGFSSAIARLSVSNDLEDDEILKIYRLDELKKANVDDRDLEILRKYFK